MNIAPAVYNLLSNDATVSGLVGSKIYPDQIPQQVAYPAIVHYKTDVNKVAVKTAPTINYRITLQIDIYCDTYGAGETIADAVKAVLDEYSGTVESINIQKAVLNNQADENFIEEQKTYVTTQNYLFRVVTSN